MRRSRSTSTMRRRSTRWRHNTMRIRTAGRSRSTDMILGHVYHRSPGHLLLTRLGVLRGSSIRVLCRHSRASSISSSMVPCRISIAHICMVCISFSLSSLICRFYVLMITSTGAYDMSGHQASSGSWGSGGYTQNPQEMQSQWFEGGYYTPPPQPTQDTQFAPDGSVLPPRQIHPPNRYGRTPPPPPPPRQPRPPRQ